ncbi:MAG: DnaJ domain-containing protein [Desulfatibacillaceae bacterium]
MKDYYKILGVDKKAAEEEIKVSYRKMAFACHPDRNPGDPTAEDRFKEVSEAYGVLGDPSRRKAYDRARMFGFGNNAQARPEDFTFNQDEIFKNLFTDPRLNKVFQDLFADLERAGYRTDTRFFDNVFFGGRGVLLGGLILLGPLAALLSARTVVTAARQAYRQGTPAYGAARAGVVLARLGKFVGKRIANRIMPPMPEGPPDQYGDLTYTVDISEDEAETGRDIEVAVDSSEKREVLRVRVPPGVRTGTRLRVRGKGRGRPDRRGDLFIVLNVVGAEQR